MDERFDMLRGRLFEAINGLYRRNALHSTMDEVWARWYAWRARKRLTHAILNPFRDDIIQAIKIRNYGGPIMDARMVITKPIV